MSDDGFVELEPQRKAAPAKAKVVLRTIKIRHGAQRVSFSLAGDLVSELADDGWPRFSIAYNAAQGRFRIASKVQGPFEALRTRKGDRVILRCPLPGGILFSENAHEAAHVIDGGVLYVTVPQPMKMNLITAGVGLAAAHEAMRTKAAANAARAAVPAPKL